MKKSAILHFRADLVEKPVLSGMIRKHDVDVNILQASVTPEEDGAMFVQLEGEPAAVEKALDYLKAGGVRITFPAKNLIWYEDKCTHCGACVAQCLPKSLYVKAGTQEVGFDHDKCIACELCIPACPFGALQSVTEHLS
ncbi:MAG: NIL domain-containing protein [bacterium]